MTVLWVPTHYVKDLLALHFGHNVPIKDFNVTSPAGFCRVIVKLSNSA